MAIRAGGGGLKYALPSQQQARQNAAAASAGGSASASAFAANRRYAGQTRQLQYDALQSGLDRRFRAQQAQEGRAFTAEQAQLGRDFTAEQSQLGRDFTAEQAATQFKQRQQLQAGSQQFTAKQSKLEQQFIEERDTKRFEQEQIAFEREVDAGIESDIRQGNLTLPPASQKKLEQLEASLSDADELDPEQRAEFQQEYERKRRELLRTAQPPTQPSLSEQFQQEIITDPETGTRFQRNRSGEWSPLESGADDYREQVTSLADSLTGTPDPNNPDHTYTREEALDAAARQMQTDEQFFGGRGEETGGGAGQPGASTDVQATASAIVGDMENIPLDPKTETPAMREFYTQNMEDIVRYIDTPTEQVPEESRAAVDFFGRHIRSSMSGEPITLRSPEEAQYLPAGTEYIDSEGNVRRKKESG